MGEIKQVQWYPTFRCNLKCPFCISRTLPNVQHHMELSSNDWIKIFSSCPSKIGTISITGGEPSLYDGLSSVLEVVPTDKIFINSNLASHLHPKEWLSNNVLNKIYGMALSYQWHPDSPGHEEFWERAVWIRENCTGEIKVQFVRTQQISNAAENRLRKKSEEMGFSLRVVRFGHEWLYRDVFPVNDGSATCTAGSDFCVILPDGELYRCIGKSHVGSSMGNLMLDGWVLYKIPVFCNSMSCSNDSKCEDISKYQLSGTGKLIKNPGLW